MNKKKLIIFDLDGTLIDTIQDLNIAINVALKKYGFPTVALDKTRRDIGNGVKKLIERSLPSDIDKKTYDDVFKTFKEYYVLHYFDNSFPYPGIKDILLELKARGYRLAVLSNKFNEGANKLVNFYFESIFDLIIGQLENYRPKPYSDLTNLLLLKLGVSKEDSLYIGDTEVDYLTAKNAGIDVILESYGYRTKKQLLELTDAKLIIDSSEDLLKILR